MLPPCRGRFRQPVSGISLMPHCFHENINCLSLLLLLRPIVSLDRRLSLTNGSERIRLSMFSYHGVLVPAVSRTITRKIALRPGSRFDPSL